MMGSQPGQDANTPPTSEFPAYLTFHFPNQRMSRLYDLLQPPRVSKAAVADEGWIIRMRLSLLHASPIQPVLVDLCAAAFN